MGGLVAFLRFYFWSALAGLDLHLYGFSVLSLFLEIFSYALLAYTSVAVTFPTVTTEVCF